MRWCLAPDFTPAAKSPGLGHDLSASLLLVFFGLAFYFVGLEVLEFFRHTEADRTLIGWEMLRRGDYIVPRLLESVILTKPPLFYWLVAAAIGAAGTAAEWAARLPSACAALILLAAQFNLLRKAGCSSRTAFFGALMTGSGGALFVLCGSAEIDMTFGLFCMLALYGVYFSTRKPQAGVLISYVMAAAAFLTKGPPIVFFFAASFVVFCLWRLLLSNDDERKDARRNFLYLVWQHMLGVLVFCAIVGLWLLALGSSVGFDVLAFEYEEEVFNRVFRESTRQRGPFFYFGSLAAGLLPWTPLLVVGLLLPFWRGHPVSYGELKKNTSYWAFFTFNLIVVVTGFLMLSLAEGKSNRYIFPIYPFAMNLALLGWLQIRGTSAGRWMEWAAMVFIAHVAGAALMLPFVSKFEAVPMVNRAAAAVLLFLGAAGMALALKRKQPAKMLLLCLVFLLFTLRFGYSYVFAEYRNAERSVKPAAAALNEAVPRGEPLYIVEMFERWVVYYMMRDGREVSRLNPDNVKALYDGEGEVYLLLQVEQEAWRLKQLSKSGTEPEILVHAEDTRDPLYVIKTSKQSLKELTLSRRAPTEASPVPPEFIAK